MFNDRLSINAMVCQFVLLTLHSLVLLNCHAYIKRGIERLLHLNEVWYGVNECIVTLLNQRSHK